MRSLLRFALLPAWLVLATTSVHADVPPLDACNQEGQACKNAGGSTGTSNGVCTATTCTRATPNGPSSYPCNRCIAEDPSKKSSTAKGCTASGLDTVSLWAALVTTSWLLTRARRQRSSASL